MTQYSSYVAMHTMYTPHTCTCALCETHPALVEFPHPSTHPGSYGLQGVPGSPAWQTAQALCSLPGVKDWRLCSENRGHEGSRMQGPPKGLHEWPPAPGAPTSSHCTSASCLPAADGPPVVAYAVSPPGDASCGCSASVPVAAPGLLFSADRERPSRATLLGGTHEGSSKLRVGSSPEARIWVGSRDHHGHSAGPSLNTQRGRCGVQYGPQTRRKCRQGRSGWCTGLESGVADAGRGGTDVSARVLPRRLVRQTWDTCQSHLVL